MLQNWIEKIDKITENVLTDFSELDNSQMNLKLDVASWSIAQCIDHIITTNEQYFKIIEQVNKGVYKTHWISFLPFVPGMFGKLIYNSVKPETRHRKSKTFTVFEPSQSNISDDILARFKMMQLQLKAYLSEIRAPNLHVTISSPVAPYIVYSLSNAINIIIAHEERHYLQAREMKERILSS